MSDRAIQGWYKVVLKAHPWIVEKKLKIGKSNRTKYTALCQQLISEFRRSEMGTEDWIASVHATNGCNLPKEPVSPAQSLKQFGLTPEPVEAEVIEEEVGGRIGAISAVYTAQPIIHLNVTNLTITRSSSFLSENIVHTMK